MTEATTQQICAICGTETWHTNTCGTCKRPCCYRHMGPWRDSNAMECEVCAARTKDLIVSLYWGEPTGQEMQRFFQGVRAMDGQVLETITRDDNKGAVVVVRVPWGWQWSMGALKYVYGKILESPQEGEAR